MRCVFRLVFRHFIAGRNSGDTKLNKSVDYVSDKVKQRHMQRTMTLSKREDAEID